MSFKDTYELSKIIGRGAFSVVHLAIHKKTGDQVAVKIIDKTVANAEEDEKRFKNEVAILKKVRHPNIIALIDIFETDSNLYLVMELVTGGELFDKIVEKTQYTERNAAGLVNKMLSAVEYLHENNIAHRDLKPENLLLKAGDDTEVMLSDFGLSKIVGENARLETACGTPYYVAPEVLSASGYDLEVDLWSVGVITYLLLCGFPPFYADTLPDVFEQIMKADFDFPDPYFTDISAEAKDFVSKLLVVEPKERFTAKQALKHPWIVKLGQDKPLNIKASITRFNSTRRLSQQNLHK